MPTIEERVVLWRHAKALATRAMQTTHGFTDIKKMAEEVVSDSSTRDALVIAEALYKDSVHFQPRMAGVLIWGGIAEPDNGVMYVLRKAVGRDKDWPVQEMLAQAFDHYCKRIGYEIALPLIEEWLQDENPNVRRTASEGLRIWTTRPYFREHPEKAIALLSALRADESEYVRKSVGNALRDITRKHGELVGAEIATWDMEDKRVAQVYHLVTKNRMK
jgi:3-methyladenine DNA glycosylase AlkC